MTYIKVYLHDIETLKEELDKYPERLEYYKKYDTFIGPTDSVDYLRKKIENEGPGFC